MRRPSLLLLLLLLRGLALQGAARKRQLGAGLPCGRSVSATKHPLHSPLGAAPGRYPKMGLLAALVAEQLGPRRWRGRWLAPQRALRPLEEVPPEARAWLQRCEGWGKGRGLPMRRRRLCSRPSAPSKAVPLKLCCRLRPQPCRSYHDARPAPAPPGSLASRVLLLTRVPRAAAGGDPTAAAAGSSDAAHADDASVGSGSSNTSSPQEDERWQAGWASGGQLAGWGVRSCRGALYDQHVSRLLGVLGDLAAPSAAAGDAADASTASSRQPLHVQLHKHSD